MIRERERQIINDQLEGDSEKKRGGEGGGGEMDCGVHARLPCHAIHAVAMVDLFMSCKTNGGGCHSCF